MANFAPYGNAIFGETLYGVPPTLGFYTPLTITPIGYDTLQITWTPQTSGAAAYSPTITYSTGAYVVSGTTLYLSSVNNNVGHTPASSPTYWTSQGAASAAATWQGQVLVRSSSGIPTSITDGTVVVNELTTPSYGFSKAFVDSGLQTGRFYYYALFVVALQNSTPQAEIYALAGTGQGLVVTDYNFANTYRGWLPEWYLDADQELATGAQPDGPLSRFLGLIGYEMDWLRSEAETLSTINNINTVSGAALPYLGANYGVTYEPELGMTRSRVLVKNAVFLYKNKGTANGIAAAASSFSGYGCDVTIGKNLGIQLDDSAFDRSVGHWQPSNASTILSLAPAGTGSGVSTPPHSLYEPVPALGAPPSGAGQNTNYTGTTYGYLPANNENVLQLTAGTGAGANIWQNVSPSTGNPPVRNIPGPVVSYDAAAAKMTLFGGVNGGTFYNDTWVWDGATWSNVSPAAAGTPSARSSPMVVSVNGANQEFIVYGGSGNNTTYVLTNTSGTWTWAQIYPVPGSIPDTRTGASIVYYANRNVVVLFGGVAPNGTLFNDTWVLTPGSGSNWNAATWANVGTRLVTYNSATSTYSYPAGAPAARSAMTMAYSTAGDTFHDSGSSYYAVGFGGRTTSAVLSETWLLGYNTTVASWVWFNFSIANSMPYARCNVSLIWHPPSASFILFGGEDFSGNALNTSLWQVLWPGFGVWTLVGGAGTLPTARSGAGTFYTTVGTAIGVFGGDQGQNDFFTITYSGTTFTWVTQSIVGAIQPLGRYNIGFSYDTTTNTGLLFGGDGTSNGNPQSTSWVLTGSGSSWTWTAILQTAPDAVYDAAMAYGTSTRTILFGGRATNGVSNATWVWNGSTSTWTKIIPAISPPARYGHTMAYDSVNSRTIIFGGYDGAGTYLNDTWALSSSNVWTQLTITTPPPARWFHAMCVTTNGNILLFGGASSSALLQDTWLFTVSTSQWAQVATTGPAARVYPVLCYDTYRSPAKVVLYGGYNAQTLTDTWFWDGSAWSQAVINSPSVNPGLGVGVFNTAKQSVTVFNNTSATWVLTAAPLNVSAAITDVVSSTATLLGVPCVAGQQIVVSAYVSAAQQATVVIKAFTIQIDWYDANGVLLSSTVGTAVTESATGWVRMYAAGTAPTNARSFGKSIKSTSTLAGDIHYIDAVQSEINTLPTAWEPPRDIKINLIPLRQNLCVNPIGLGGTVGGYPYGWSPSPAAAGALASSTAAINWPPMTYSGLALTLATTATYATTSIPLPFNGIDYTFSCYMRPASASPRTVTITVTYYNGSVTFGPSISSTVEITGQFVRLAVTAQAPYSSTDSSKTADHAKIDIKVVAGVLNEVHYIGAVLFEPSSIALPYFDGNFSPYTDYSFEGTPNQSASDYYPQQSVHLFRLIEAMPDYTPIGSTFSLVTGAIAAASTSNPSSTPTSTMGSVKMLFTMTP